jgi:hypothetical protein
MGPPIGEQHPVLHPDAELAEHLTVHRVRRVDLRLEGTHSGLLRERGGEALVRVTGEHVRDLATELAS